MTETQISEVKFQKHWNDPKEDWMTRNLVKEWQPLSSQDKVMLAIEIDAATKDLAVNIVKSANPDLQDYALRSIERAIKDRLEQTVDEMFEYCGVEESAAKIKEAG